MATLNITEFDSLANIEQPGQFAQCGKLNENTVYQSPVTYTTSTQSAQFAATTKFIRVMSTALAYLVAGENPTATTSGAPIQPGVEYYFGVESNTGTLWKVAAYDGTS